MRRRRRGLVLAAALLAAAVGYAALVPGIEEDTAGSEQRFGAPPPRAGEGGGAAPVLGVYLDILGVSPSNETLHVRLHATPGPALRGERPNSPGRDLVLRVDDGYAAQEIAMRADEATAPAVVDLGLGGGTAAAYPFERFRATVRIAAQEGFRPAPGEAARAVPVSLTVWEGIAGWTVRSAAAEAGAGGGDVEIRLDVRRTGASAFLALALYGVMALIAGAALTIGVLVFLRVRKGETTLASLLSGMLFALPAMRYALPGTPPLGVHADMLVFLWAELAVALGLLLLVVTWATGGPRPE